MALYTGFGDCAACETLYPSPAAPAPEPVFYPPGGPGPTTIVGGGSTTIDVSLTGGSAVAAPSRWWLWLAIGLALGYLANER